jgi:hypothetical protein
MISTEGSMPLDMKVTLDEAWQLYAYEMPGSQAFAHKLASVRSALAEVPVAVVDEIPRWVKVRLNSLDAQLDAVRFTNPCDYPVDLLCAFAFEKKNPGLVGGNITSEKILRHGFTDYKRKEHLELPGLDPANNAVVFQQLDGGQIAPGQECFLWFAFNTPMTTEVYVKLRLVKPDPDEYPHFPTAHPIAERLGFEVPFRFTESASFADRVKDVAEYRGIEAGLESLAKADDREAEFLYAEMAHQHALRLAVESGDRDGAKPYFVKAAESMRAFRKKYRRLNADEAKLLQTALYNEACSFATTGQPEKSLESLREAVSAGFHDLTHILKDDDLKSVRELPAFDDFINEFDERAQSPVP